MGLLIRVKQRSNVQGHLSIIEDLVRHVILMVYPAWKGYFQKDSAPYHKAFTVRRWFEEYDKNLPCLVVLPNHQISIHLRIIGMRSNEA